MPLQLFVPTFRVEECLEEIRECLEKGWTGLGFKTVEFEGQWKEYTGLAHAHFLNSATVGLGLAVKILKMQNNWSEEDEIITTPLTFVSSNHAILYENLKPVFADVDDYLCMDPNDVERKITEKTKAILFVGMGGSAGKYNEIVELCRKHDLKLILDAAHMAGTRINGEIPGKEADAVVYSFQAVKNLPTADSGMICFKEKENDELCRKLTWLGINKDTYARSNERGAYKWKYDVEYVGYKYHGNSIMAAIALVQLKYLEQDNAYRRQLAKWYRDGLKQYVKIVDAPNECETSQHLFIIEVDRRDELLLALNEAEIYPGVHYRDNTEYSMYSYAHGTCPIAHEKSKKVISLPLHIRMNKEDVDFVVEQIKKFVKMS